MDALKFRQIAFAMAYRMLGDAEDAEDLAQNCAVKFLQIDWQTIRKPEAFVATMAARLSLNQLRKVQTQQVNNQKYALPLPQLTTNNLDKIDAKLDLSYGIIMLSQKLPPLPRAVFILRSAFDMSFDEIATALDRKTSTCRQAHSRGKKTMQQPTQDNLPVSSTIINQLSAHILSGNIEALTKLLAKDIIFYSDGGGVAPDLGRPVSGASRIAQFLSVSPKLLGGNVSFRSINTAHGQLLLAEVDGKLQLIVIAEMSDQKIIALYAISDPVKLDKLAQQLKN